MRCLFKRQQPLELLEFPKSCIMGEDKCTEQKNLLFVKEALPVQYFMRTQKLIWNPPARKP